LLSPIALAAHTY